MSGLPSRLRYRLLSPGGHYLSESPGLLGGHSRSRIYGQLDCPSALAALARGGYRDQRVFFADEDTAIACGYRPCGRCLRERYQTWKREFSIARGA